MTAYIIATIERFELLLQTSLDETQRRLVETLLAEARGKLALLQGDPFPLTPETTRLTTLAPRYDGQSIAARNLTKDATLDELRGAARDLRVLAPGSALADLVDAKIASTLAALTREEVNLQAEASLLGHADEVVA